MIIKPVFTWSPVKDRTTPGYTTWGTFCVYVNDELFWGSPEFEWTWYELLDWLSLNWKKLNAPTTYPNRDEWFEYHHNLDQSLQGALPSSLLLWRTETAGFLRKDVKGTDLKTDESVIDVLMTDADTWTQFLVETADAIAERVKNFNDPLSVQLYTDYQNAIQKGA